jgi:hypothetical protein
MYLSETAIPTERYTSVYLTNPVLRQIVGLLVWSQGGKTFVLKNGTAIDSEMQPYVLGTEEIFVAHPMEMKKNEVEAWQNYFVSHNLKQPFSQIWEPIIDPSTIKEDRYVGCYIPFYCFRNREKHGITIEDDNFHDDIDIELKDCDATIERIDWHRHEINNDDNFEITRFGFKKYSRQVNHIVAYLDKITVIGRILKDDMAVEQFLPQFTFAQLKEFIKLASENNCLNVTALLLDYKNRTFGAFDPMEEFVLEI